MRYFFVTLLRKHQYELPLLHSRYGDFLMFTFSISLNWLKQWTFVFIVGGYSPYTVKMKLYHINSFKLGIPQHALRYSCCTLTMITVKCLMSEMGSVKMRTHVKVKAITTTKRPLNVLQFYIFFIPFYCIFLEQFIF